MNVIVEIFHRGGQREDLPDDMIMIIDDIFQGIRMEVIAGLQIQELTEREAAEVVAFHDTIEFGVLLFQPHDAGACEDDLQLREEVITTAELHAPVGFLEHLVNEEGLAAMVDEIAGKISNAVAMKIEVVHIHVQTRAVTDTELLLGILQQEGRLPYPSRTFNADKAVVPVDLIHKGATDRGVRMLQEVVMSSEEGFFHFSIELYL